jgi:hypothetical protein
MLLPDVTGSWESTGLSDHILLCARVIPRFSITNATAISAAFTNAGDTCRVAIYEDADAGALLASGSGTCIAGANPFTGLSAFSLTAGTPVRICVCKVSGTHAAWGVSAPSSTAETAGLLRAFTTNAVGTGNDCTSSVPSTTGSLTGIASRLIPLVAVSK